MRRLQEALSLVFPLLAVLFIPIALGVHRIYLWADPPADLPAPLRELLAAKRAWLNPAGFVIRSVLYLAVFVIASEVLRRWSRARDADPPAGEAEDVLRRDRVFAAAMLPPVQTSVGGLQIADTGFYYPEDRGISESVRLGRIMAEQVA